MNKKTIISNSIEEEYNYFINAIAKKAAMVPKKRLMIITTDKEYYNNLIDKLKEEDMNIKQIGSEYCSVKNGYNTIAEIVNLRSIFNLQEFLTGKRVDCLYIKLTDISSVILHHNKSLMNKIYLSLIHSEDSTVTFITDGTCIIKNEISI